MLVLGIDGQLRLSQSARRKGDSPGGSDKGGSDTGGSDKGGSYKGGSYKGGSDNGGSDTGGSDKGGSDKGGSDKGGSGQVAVTTPNGCTAGLVKGKVYAMGGRAPPSEWGAAPSGSSALLL
jgi:hypothetical protein